jgi:hypothetical protein
VSAIHAQLPGAMTQPDVVGAPEHLNGGHDIAAFK